VKGGLSFRLRTSFATDGMEKISGVLADVLFLINYGLTFIYVNPMAATL
jgi:ABC-type glucose/galactose transport system permease subunit